MSELQRGCLYYVDLGKRRRALVVSPDVRNTRANDVLVVPCTTRLLAAPTHVKLRKGEGGLRHASMAKCEQLTTLPKEYVHGTALGPPLVPERMREIERAILRAIGVPVPLP